MVLDADRWQRVAAVYHEALDLPASGRAAWLAAECGDDEPLRREVEALLSYETDNTVLDRSALEIEALAIARDRRDIVGTMVGGYQVIEFLGAGGMGDVYRARDPRLERDVALKVFQTSASLEPIARIEAEGRAASALTHPNIVTIYGVGEDGDVAYIAMELVSGRRLRDLLASGPIPSTRSLDIASQLAGAMAAAHARGIVHGDLKPENVMIAADGLVKVLDFGIATLQRERDVGDDEVSHRMAGTRGYMAPEQAHGLPAVPASDRFAFGVICQEMITGVRAGEPIDGGSPLSPVIRRCLAAEPSARYADSAALVDAIRAVRSAPAIGRRRALSLLAMGCAGAVAGAAVWRWRPRATPARTLLVLPFGNPAGDENAAYLCDGIAETLIAGLGRLPDLTVMARATAFSFRRSTVDPRTIGQRLGVDAVLTGTLARRAGRLRVSAELVDAKSGARLWGAEFDRPADDVLAVENEIAEAILEDGLHVPVADAARRRMDATRTDDPTAYDLFLLGVHHLRLSTENDYLAARVFLERAVERAPRFTLALVTLASTYSAMAVDGYEAPSAAWPESMRCTNRALAIDPDLPDAHFEAASSAFYYRWDWAEAERQWDLALRLRSEVQSEMLVARAFMKWAVGDARAGLELAQAARQVDPLNPIASLRVADLQADLQQLDEAAATYEAVLREASDNTSALVGLAEVRAAQGRFADAIRMRQRAHEIVGGAPSGRLVGNPQGAAGYAEIVRASARAVLTMLERRQAAGGFVSALDFARTFAQLGETARAFVWLQGALDEHASGLVALNVDPVWRPYRHDPRFAAAVTHVGIPSQP